MHNTIAGRGKHLMLSPPLSLSLYLSLSVSLSLSPFSVTHTNTFLGSCHIRYMDEHGIDVHCLVPLPWLECEPRLHADEAKAIEVTIFRSRRDLA